MDSSIQRLLRKKVSDIMTQSVFTISTNCSMTEAAKSLIKHEVSGAPVVDEQGRCVGILSTTDFTRREQWPDVEYGSSRGNDFVLKSDSEWGTLHIEEDIEDRVGRHMTTAVQTIAASASISEAVRYMSGEHIHRLVVIDSNSHPVGIVTSLDLITALASEMEDTAPVP